MLVFFSGVFRRTTSDNTAAIAVRAAIAMANRWFSGVFLPERDLAVSASAIERGADSRGAYSEFQGTLSLYPWAYYGCVGCGG